VRLDDYRNVYARAGGGSGVLMIRDNMPLGQGPIPRGAHGAAPKLALHAAAENAAMITIFRGGHRNTRKLHIECAQADPRGEMRASYRHHRPEPILTGMAQ